MSKRARGVGFVERLKWAREAVGLSARELSRRAGIAESIVALLEKGAKANANVDTISALARTLGVSMDWLYDGEGKRPSLSVIRAAVALAPDHDKTGTDS